MSKLFSRENINGSTIIKILGIKIRHRNLEKKIEDMIERILAPKVDVIISNQKRMFNKVFETIMLSNSAGVCIEEAAHKMYLKYPKAKGFLRDIQICNLKLMKELKNTCDKLNIKFWLHAGTLIGAIRNSGFIPWDDDVDVAMTRDDFLVLKNALKDNEILILEEYYNQITCSRQYQLKFKNGLPVFIDIVQYDRCNAKSVNECKEFMNIYNDIYQKMLSKYKNDLKSPQVIDIGYYMVGKYEGETKKQVDKIIDEAIDELRQYETNEDPSWYYAIENYPFPYPVLTNDEMFPLVEVPFEDTVFYAPNNSIKYLRPYGNIWYPPGDIGKIPHTYAFEHERMLINEFANKA